MSLLRGWLKPAKRPCPRASEVEARFLRLYSRWHETHDLSLRKRLFVRLSLLMRRMPNFDLRSRFEQAF